MEWCDSVQVLVKCLIKFTFHFQVSYQNFRKTTSDSYELTLNIPDFEMCKVLNGLKQNSKFLETLLNVAKLVPGNLMKMCKGPGEIKYFNFTLINSTVTALFPNGNYKTIFKFYDDIDDNIMNTTYFATISH